MDIDTIITQIKTYCPFFEGRVAGAASYAEGIETVVNMALPACYVIPLEDTATGNADTGYNLYQTITETIAVIVHLDNSVRSGGDRRGQAVATSLQQIRTNLFAAILNFNPYGFGSDHCNQGLRYTGGSLETLDRARMFWSLNFAVDATWTDADGFLVPGEPLEQINLTIPNPNDPDNEIEVGIQPQS